MTRLVQVTSCTATAAYHTGIHVIDSSGLVLTHNSSTDNLDEGFLIMNSLPLHVRGGRAGQRKWGHYRHQLSPTNCDQGLRQFAAPFYVTIMCPVLLSGTHPTVGRSRDLARRLAPSSPGFDSTRREIHR